MDGPYQWEHVAEPAAAARMRRWAATRRASWWRWRCTCTITAVAAWTCLAASWTARCCTATAFTGAHSGSANLRSMLRHLVFECPAILCVCKICTLHWSVHLKTPCSSSCGSVTLWAWHTASWAAVRFLAPCPMLLVMHQPHPHQPWRLNRCLSFIHAFIISFRCPNMRAIGHVCRTNHASNTAFRGFGGPQARSPLPDNDGLAIGC